MPAKFKDNLCLVGGKELPAPIKPYGPSELFEAIQQLAHDDLVAIAKDLKFEVHGLMPTQLLMMTVAHELQYQWYDKATNGIPAGVEKNHANQLVEYARELKNIKEGKVPKAEAAKKERKVAAAKKREAKVEKPLAFSVFKSKVEASKYADKVKDPKVASHLPLVTQVLMTKAEKSWALGDIVDAVKATKRYSIKGSVPIEKCVQSDLRILEKEGLVKAVEAA